MKSKYLYLIVSLSVVAALVALAVFAQLLIKNPYKPSADTLDVDEIEISGDAQTTPPVGGDVVQADVEALNGKYYRTLSAVADDSHVFAYWTNSRCKLSGDVEITLSSATLDGLSAAINSCVPVFISKTNVCNISTQTDFNSFVTDVTNNETENKMYVLQADIYGLNLSSSLGVFRGVFDGNNHTLSGFALSGNGLFTSISGGVVKNLILSDGKIETNNSQYVGGVCASINEGLISRTLCYLEIKNSIANGYAGGIVGSCTSNDKKSMLFSCGFYGTVDAENAQEMIAYNVNYNGTNEKSCVVLKPKNNGAKTNI